MYIDIYIHTYTCIECIYLNNEAPNRCGLWITRFQSSRDRQRSTCNVGDVHIYWEMKRSLLKGFLKKVVTVPVKGSGYKLFVKRKQSAAKILDIALFTHKNVYKKAMGLSDVFIFYSIFVS